MTARATMKAARATVAGATWTTAVMVATMTPHGDKDNEDGNSKKQSDNEAANNNRGG